MFVISSTTKDIPFVYAKVYLVNNLLLFVTLLLIFFSYLPVRYSFGCGFVLVMGKFFYQYIRMDSFHKWVVKILNDSMNVFYVRWSASCTYYMYLGVSKVHLLNPTHLVQQCVCVCSYLVMCGIQLYLVVCLQLQ